MRGQFALATKAAAKWTDKLDAPGNAVDASVRRADAVPAGRLRLKAVASSPVAEQLVYCHVPQATVEYKGTPVASLAGKQVLVDRESSQLGVLKAIRTSEPYYPGGGLSRQTGIPRYLPTLSRRTRSDCAAHKSLTAGQ